jgi:hypothetical protein
MMMAQESRENTISRTSTPAATGPTWARYPAIPPEKAVLPCPRMGGMSELDTGPL